VNALLGSCSPASSICDTWQAVQVVIVAVILLCGILLTWVRYEPRVTRSESVRNAPHVRDDT